MLIHASDLLILNLFTNQSIPNSGLTSVSKTVHDNSDFDSETNSWMKPPKSKPPFETRLLSVMKPIQESILRLPTPNSIHILNQIDVSRHLGGPKKGPQKWPELRPDTSRVENYSALVSGRTWGGTQKGPPKGPQFGPKFGPNLVHIRGVECAKRPWPFRPPVESLLWDSFEEPLEPS